MGKNIKKLADKKLIDRHATTLDKFLEFNPNEPEDAVEFHKYKLLFQLNEFMLKHGISKADLARKLNISRQAVTNKFLGETLTLDWIVRAFTVLGVGLEMKQSPRNSIAA